MDYRSQIIENIMMVMMKHVDGKTLDLISDSLSIELEKYDVQKKCTELTVYDDSYIRDLKRFIVCKQIEGMSKATLKRYYRINEEMLEFLHKPIKEITTNDLRCFLATKRRTGKVCNRSLDGMRRCYSSFFSWAAAEGIIDRSPCLALKQIKYKKQVKKAFTATEMERIKEACGGSKRNLALVEVLYATGVRVSELCSINVEDVDFDTSEIIVLGKGNKERTVYLSDVAAMRLKDYLESRKDCNEALFVGRGGRRLSKTGVEVALRGLGKKAGVSGVYPHRFRRTLATMLLNRGMDIVSVAEILGHADLRTTQIYCTISRNNVKYNYQKLIAA